MDLPSPTLSGQSSESPDSSMTSLTTDSSKSEGVEDPLLLSPLFLFPGGEDTSPSSSSGSSSQNSGSPRNDWALPGAMWSQYSDSKTQTLDDLGSLSMSLNFLPGLSQDQWSSMDMDADISAFIPDPPQHLSIDPNALHFGNTVYNESQQHQGQAPASENYNSMFQFTLSQPSDTAPESLPPFQLPTPKPGSTSSRSVSPALSKAEHNSSAGVNPSDLSLITQLGQKARDAAGVMLAVPEDRRPQASVESQAPVTPVSPVSINSQVPQPKIPIPRLRPTGTTPQKSQSIFSPTEQPTPPASQSSSPSSASHEPASTTTKSGRPKTSHTTIERRYRTNLNARILALRRAVPALRILEKNTPQQTQGKGLTGASAPKWDFDDVVNARGYVDGVKAAKKNSKGVVLGKAVEYIKALKRREIRLKRESDGLRALLSGLVGGPELLREWEKEWQERFGGEEGDEVDEDEDDNEDGEEGEGDAAEDAESDEEDGRAKKRARVEKKERKPAPQTEKRKRGRPRKTPISVPDAPHLILQPPDVQDQRQPSKYLLAAFMFFSFFNPNAPASSTPSHGHEGAVLTHALPDAVVVPASNGAAGWTVMQAVHMLVSVLLLLSLVGAYLPKRVTRLLPDALLFASPNSASAASPSVAEVKPKAPAPGPAVKVSRGAAISDALASGDEQALRSALGADGGVYSVLVGVSGAALRALRLLRGSAGPATTRQEDLELRGWRRLGQIEVLRGEDSPLLARIQTYLSLSSRLPSALASLSDKVTLALLAYPFAESTAIELWGAARRMETKTSSETLVLDMDIEEAARIVVVTPSETCEDGGGGDEQRASPIHRIASHVVLIRAKALAANKFVASVSGTRIVDIDGENNGEFTPAHDAEAKAVISAGRELGGGLNELMCLLDKVERCPAAEVLAGLAPCDSELETDSSDASSSSDGGSGSDAAPDDAARDVRVLLLATLLYRRIFPSADTAHRHVLSPPPSPTPRSAALHLALRRALASGAFDDNSETEDARDRVVDMLAETRRGRWGGLY